MIPCKLIPMKENTILETEASEYRYGRYITNFFPVKGLGRNCWVIVVNIDVEYDSLIAEGLTLEEIALGCVKFLNFRPKSRYGKKRLRKPLYGVFRPKPYNFKLMDKGGKKYIQALLITEDRKNIKFWKEGKKEIFYSWKRKRKR